MKILYTTSATSTGGRSGHSRSADGVLDVTLTSPKALGGDGAAGTNPEQLFAAGYSACFLGALKVVAGKEKVKVPADTSVTATVGIGPRDEGTGCGLDVDLGVNIPGVVAATACASWQKAQVVCHDLPRHAANQH